MSTTQKWQPTIATIIVITIVCIILFDLLYTCFVSLVKTQEEAIEATKPQELPEVYSSYYSSLDALWDFFKQLIENKFVFAILIAISIVLLALELPVKRPGY